VSVFLNRANQATGGSGTDSLSGIENLTGSAFADILRGDGGNNVLSGGLGDDALAGGAGNDTLSGSQGRDSALYNAAGMTTGVTVDLLITTAQNTGGAGTDTLLAIEDLTGSSFADVLLGSGFANALRGGAEGDLLDGRGGNDALSGQTGNDTLLGGDGADKLLGDEGSDVLTGGLGADQLTGGADADRFVFTAITDSTVSAPGRDRIFDFNRAEGDLIDLSGIDAVAGGADDAFTVVTAFTKVAGQLVIRDGGAYTLVQADVNGDGAADFAIYVDGGNPSVASDLVL
jgi:Ca2+-binding RTX toxin-like protein